MKKSMAVFLGLGVFLFFLGLSLLLGQETVLSLMSIPKGQASELAGVVLQGFGALLVLSVAINSSSEVATKRAKQNQAVLLSLMESVSRLEKRTSEFAEKLVALERTNDPQSSFSKCKFCGATVERRSGFCSSCGKAQK